MDLNLYLGLPRSPRPRSLELGSDLSLSSFPPPASSDSGESRAPEATSTSMKASASHAPHSPSPSFIEESGVPSAGSCQPAVENPTVREIEGPTIEHSPLNSHVLQAENAVVETEERAGEPHAAFEEILGHHFADDNSAQGVASQPPYSPSFHDGENIATFLSLLSQNRSEPNSTTDFRIQRSLRQSLLCVTERTDFAPHTSASHEQLIQERSSQQTIGTNGKQKAPAEVVSVVSSENEAEEKNRCATNFGCNICSNIANEPVVTSCGHLFCWPCLHRWLHFHSNCKECPVCKGGVTEANITPIYGRGCSRSGVENKDEEKSGSGRSIPPRPRGNRLESWRHHSYPILERVGEGIVSPWRRFLNHHFQDRRSRFSGREDVLVQEVLSGGSPANLTGSTTRRVQREQGITDSGPSYVESGAEFIHNEIDTMQRLYCLPAIDSLASMSSDIGLIVGRFTENTDFIEPSLSVNGANPGQFVSIPIVGTRPAADQASFSSTTAVICSESSVRGASAEPNCAGSSRPYRRARGSSSSGSDDDGGNLRAPKRRKLC